MPPDKPAPRRWMIVVDSYGRRRRISADTHANALDGDLVAIYSRAAGAFVAIGWQDSFKHTPPWWHWPKFSTPRHWQAKFQTRPLLEAMTLPSVQKADGLSDWSALIEPHQPVLVPAKRWRLLAPILIGTDEESANRLESWETRSHDETTPRRGFAEHEEFLSCDIAYALVRSRRCRLPRASDQLFGPGIKWNNVWREHPLEYGVVSPPRLDLLLVRGRGAEQTLVAIEVKREADYHKGNDPRKIIVYCKALRRKYPGWRVKPLVVALWFDRRMHAELRRKRVETLRYREDTGRLAAP
jgi:hypothetical protein